MTDAQSPMPQDAFSKRFRELSDNPGAIKASSTINLIDDYGNTESWIVDTFRLEVGKTVVFLQRLNSKGSDRLVLPTEVMAAISRQHDRAISAVRSRAAKRRIATLESQGIDPAAALKRTKRKKR